jgi:hypothetical protein
VTVGSAALAGLRERLHEMRDDALQQLADCDPLDAGLLALLGDIGAALAAIDGITSPPRRRGGDPCADKRADRDEALRALARLNGNDVPVELVARKISNRLGRYRPLPDETIPERVLMRAVIDTGLPVPSAERIRKILGLVKQRNRLDDQTAPPH